MHAQTLEAGVLCLEQKASKCLTYKQGFGLGFCCSLLPESGQNTAWLVWKGDFLQIPLMLLAKKQLSSTGSDFTGRQRCWEILKVQLSLKPDWPINRPAFHLLYPWLTQGSFNLYEVTIIRKQCKEYKVLTVTTVTIKSLLLGANRSFETSGRLH